MLLINALLAFTILGGAAPQLKVAATPRVEGAVSTPTRACPSTAHTGTFRVTTMTHDSSTSRVGMILLENVDGCLEALMLTDQNGPAIIDHLSVSGDMITGSIRMTHGLGRVSLRVSETGIAGSILDGRNEWSIAGKRTN
jgi:hypothetical protein